MTDLSNLIDLSLLQTFGENTIVPLAGAIGTLANIVESLDDGRSNTLTELQTCVAGMEKRLAVVEQLLAQPILAADEKEQEA